jgi:predicted permease
MKQEKKQTKKGWTSLQILGGMLSVLGVLMIIYYSYSFLSPGTSRFAGGSGFNPSGLNGTFRNSTGFNGTSRFAYPGARRSFGAAYPVLSGILMLLLGLTVFKYGGLKARVG